MSTPERRKTINWKGRPEQHFVIMEAVLMLLLMVYLLYMIFVTVNSAIESLPPNQQIELAPIFDQISYVLLLRISILFIVVTLFNVLLGLIYLHRITGPMTKIKGVLDQIASGNIPEQDAALRKKDYGKDVVNSLNDALRKLRLWRK